jgi:hypothetical protein
MQRIASMTLLLTAVMRVVAGAMLPLANLVGHFALFAGLFAILMGGFASIMLRFTSNVPVVLTFLVFQFALSVLLVTEMVPIVVRGRRMVARRRWWRRFAVVVRRPRLRASSDSGPQPQNQNRRDH